MKFGKSLFVFIVLFLIFPFVTSAAPVIPSITETNEAQALISGVTSSGTDVVVYVDDDFLGLAQVNPSETETNSFSFSAFGLLPMGDHDFKVAAKDIETRSLSKFSPEFSLFINRAASNQPKVSEEAVEEVVIEEEKPMVETESADDEYLLDIDNLSETDQSETEKNEKILRWNLVIFILFLIAIISWIFWVNHELKKEKEEQEKQE